MEKNDSAMFFYILNDIVHQFLLFAISFFHFE